MLYYALCHIYYIQVSQGTSNVFVKKDSHNHVHHTRSTYRVTSTLHSTTTVRTYPSRNVSVRRVVLSKYYTARRTSETTFRIVHSPHCIA